MGFFLQKRLLEFAYPQPLNKGYDGYLLVPPRNVVELRREPILEGRNRFIFPLPNSHERMLILTLSDPSHVGEKGVNPGSSVLVLLRVCPATLSVRASIWFYNEATTFIAGAFPATPGAGVS
ncbi:hypothetical protein LIER_29893 [Lithospermum erythrorhizon]|uniref:Uncharacterized protein n=1 Tax=Lithospermum erythrorhizon TaxID=34254 RepID=A0AAV3RPC0_LITER